MRKHLATMAHNSTVPHNHGEVEISDDGWVNGETPVEDYGMYYVRDEPFPPSGSEELFQIFLALMAESEE